LLHFYVCKNYADLSECVFVIIVPCTLTLDSFCPPGCKKVIEGKVIKLIWFVFRGPHTKLCRAQCCYSNMSLCPSVCLSPDSSI